MSLAPCPSCARHVKTSEKSCPFCKSALPESLADSAIPGATHRLGRAAAFAFTASLTVAGCSAGIAPVGGDGGSGDEGGAGDSGSNDSSTVFDSAPKKDGSTPQDDGGVQPPYGAPAYGAPAVDSGK